jgi:hypothetical protein
MIKKRISFFSAQVTHFGLTQLGQFIGTGLPDMNLGLLKVENCVFYGNFIEFRKSIQDFQISKF